MEPKKDIFFASILSILWWVSLWYLFDEIITLVSGNKWQLKIAICVTIIILIYLYCIMNPSQIESL